MKTKLCPKCDGKGYIITKEKDTFCHTECMGKNWMLMESDGGTRRKIELKYNKEKYETRF